MTAQVFRAIVMAIAAVVTVASPDAGQFVTEHAEAVVALLTAAWAMVAGWQAWRKKQADKDAAELRPPYGNK